MRLGRRPQSEGLQPIVSAPQFGYTEGQLTCQGRYSLHERHYSRGRLRHPAASPDTGCQQAAHAGLRQADDLLPAQCSDAGGHSRKFSSFPPRTICRTLPSCWATGSVWAAHLNMPCRSEPNGLAQAFVIGEKFIGKDKVALILGDNIFYGSGMAAPAAETTTTRTAGSSLPTMCRTRSATASWSLTKTARPSLSKKSPRIRSRRMPFRDSTCTTTMWWRSPKT